MSLLKSEIRISGLTLSSRLVMPPMATGKSTDEGCATEDLCRYYDEKTAGGALGLVITEHSFISPEGRAGRGQVSLASDSTAESLKKLTETIHKNGVPVFAQLNHAGAAADPALTGLPSIGPSMIELPRRDRKPDRVMDENEIRRVTDAFAHAAVRAKNAGYDGVEIHSAHGYLLNQFYSPLTNCRTDAYTGSTLEGRIRFHLEVIEAVRTAVGPDYPVALRLGACDYMKGGSTAEDSVAACTAFEKAGIDLLDISGGLCGYTIPGLVNPPEGYFSPLTSAIRSAVSIPVILTGGIVTPHGAEKLLENGSADLIGVGRALLKDSRWAANALSSL